MNILTFKKFTSGFNRPRSLLIFVNPFGGKRKAPKIYEEQIAPLFELVGISTLVISKYNIVFYYVLVHIIIQCKEQLAPKSLQLVRICTQY